MMDDVALSYRYCRRVARSRARNFYYSFVLLSRPQRDAMCAMYAFMRYCDDLSDEPGPRARPSSAGARTWTRRSPAVSAAIPSGPRSTKPCAGSPYLTSIFAR